MDILYRRTFWDSVRGLSKGRSIVLITHMMEEADYLCDRLAIMVEGAIVCAGTALSLKTRCVAHTIHEEIQIFTRSYSKLARFRAMHHQLLGSECCQVLSVRASDSACSPPPGTCALWWVGLICV